ncbi:type I glyceraldehyde-3-phosphate dehydrogenase [bacterium]|nr:type I glyceraldehyde-3-phosphate dehydrogenase [bacterium]
MGVKVAINGFGRIGRSVLRRAFDLGDLDIVAVNDLTSPETLAHLLKYDSVMGRYPGSVRVSGDSLVVGDRTVRVLSEKDPAALPWADLGVDVVIESTGLFLAPHKAVAHMHAGAKKVVLTAPAKNSTPEELEKARYTKASVDATICVGVNDETYDPALHHIISNASCTTNCLAPVAKVLHESFGIIAGLMTTIHSYTNDQRLLDLPHKDLRRARAAAVSMIPTSTGAAKAVGLVLPALAGRLDGMAVRVPTPNVSLVDLSVQTEKRVTVESVNAAMKAAAEGPLSGVLRYVDEPLVSIDFQGDPHSSSFDSLVTKTSGDNFVKILSWYDNEWGYSCRLVDLARIVASRL